LVSVFMLLIVLSKSLVAILPLAPFGVRAPYQAGYRTIEHGDAGL
jgi:hypothetical protein